MDENLLHPLLQKKFCTKIFAGVLKSELDKILGFFISFFRLLSEECKILGWNVDETTSYDIVQSTGDIAQWWGSRSL